MLTAPDPVAMCDSRAFVDEAIDVVQASLFVALRSQVSKHTGSSKLKFTLKERFRTVG